VPLFQGSPRHPLTPGRLFFSLLSFTFGPSLLPSLPPAILRSSRLVSGPYAAYVSPPPSQALSRSLTILTAIRPLSPLFLPTNLPTPKAPKSAGFSFVPNLPLFLTSVASITALTSRLFAALLGVLLTNAHYNPPFSAPPKRPRRLSPPHLPATSPPPAYADLLRAPPTGCVSSRISCRPRPRRPPPPHPPPHLAAFFRTPSSRDSPSSASLRCPLPRAMALGRTITSPAPRRWSRD